LNIFNPFLNELVTEMKDHVSFILWFKISSDLFDQYDENLLKIKNEISESVFKSLERKND
jgi:hypothetical protein